MRLAFILAALAVAAPQAIAAPLPVEMRWCTVNNPGLGNIQWDCRYPTLAACAATVGWGGGACLQNPNWDLRRAPGSMER
jgi:hypothetical protein